MRCEPTLSPPTARSVSFVLGTLALLLAIGLRSASAQLISDNFSDGAMGSLWTSVAGSPSVAVAEANGRLEFRTTGSAQPGGKQFAGYVSRNWHLRTTSDFRVRMSFRSAPSGVTTTLGSKQAIGLGLWRVGTDPTPGGLPGTTDLFEVGARRHVATATYRWLAHGRYGWLGGWDLAAWYATPQAPTNFTHVEFPAYTLTLGYEATFYVRYAAATDTIYVSTSSYTDPDAHSAQGITNGEHPPMAIFLGGYADLSGTLTGADSWCDNFQVDLATLDAAPGSLEASDGAFADRVRVAWTAAPNATGYKVFRRSGSGSDALLATLGPATLQYDDVAAVAGTAYTYTVRTVTSFGDGYGDSDGGYRGLAGPTGLAAGDGTSTAGVNLSWNAVTNAVGYRVFRAEGTGAPVEIATPATTTHTDATAVAGTTYTYTVKARFASTDSAASAADTGWRSLPVPASVVATDGTLTTGVTVTWGAVTGATGYRVFRAAGAGAFAQVGAPAGLTYTDSTATAGTLYNYKVSAASPAGVSMASAADSGWRNVAAPTGVAATDGTSASSVTVTWAATSEPTGYKVFRALGSAAATQVGGTLPPTPASFVDATGVAGTVYTYTVRAVTAAGDSAASTGNTGWRNLAAPTGVTATDGTLTTGVTVSWTAVTGAIGYRVYRAVGAGAAAEIGAPAAATFTDTTAAAGTIYTYTVKARSTPGDSAASAGETGWRNVAAPAGVNATDGTLTTGVTVTWTGVAGATGYRVLRAIGAGAASEVGAPAAATFSDTTAVAGTIYTYTVKARTAAGDSAPSASNTGWRNLSAPAGVSATDGTLATGVTVTWTPVTGAGAYGVFRAIGAGAATEIGAPAATTFTDATAVAGTVYNYTVKARTAAGDSAASTANSGWRNAAAPTDVTASDGTFTTKVRVEWTASPEATVTGYRVLRKLPTEAAPVQVAVVTPRTTVLYDDTTIAVGVLGTYTVQAQTAAGNSASSIADTGFRASSSAILASPPPGGSAGVGGADGAAGGTGSSEATDGAVAGSGRTAGAAADPGSTALPGKEPHGSLDAMLSSGAGLGQLPGEEELVARIRDAIAAAERDGSDAGRVSAGRLRDLVAKPAGVGDRAECAAMRMLHGDVNLDGTVDDADLDAYMDAVLAGDEVIADLDRDGIVAGADLRALLQALANAGGASRGTERPVGR